MAQVTGARTCRYIALMTRGTEFEAHKSGLSKDGGPYYDGFIDVIVKCLVRLALRVGVLVLGKSWEREEVWVIWNRIYVVILVIAFCFFFLSHGLRWLYHSWYPRIPVS